MQNVQQLRTFVYMTGPYQAVGLVGFWPDHFRDGRRARLQEFRLVPDPVRIMLHWGESLCEAHPHAQPKSFRLATCRVLERKLVFLKRVEGGDVGGPS